MRASASFGSRWRRCLLRASMPKVCRHRILENESLKLVKRDVGARPVDAGAAPEQLRDDERIDQAQVVLLPLTGLASSAAEHAEKAQGPLVLLSMCLAPVLLSGWRGRARPSLRRCCLCAATHDRSWWRLRRWRSRTRGGRRLRGRLRLDRHGIDHRGGNGWTSRQCVAGRRARNIIILVAGPTATAARSRTAPEEAARRRRG
mmetsp:Transcript_64852/g.188005  ORF Transcript_64852/g.188005 Transcript_64852/m.188005 type:complete len:203 (+) Transcript_64852:184-792(+)